MRDEPPRCSSCGDVIGTYEPLAVLEAGSVRTTSLAREPHLSKGPSRLLHAVCAPPGVALPADDERS
jgi:hypothetical protein